VAEHVQELRRDTEPRRSLDEHGGRHPGYFVTRRAGRLRRTSTTAANPDESTRQDEVRRANGDWEWWQGGKRRLYFPKDGPAQIDDQPVTGGVPGPQGPPGKDGERGPQGIPGPALPPRVRVVKTVTIPKGKTSVVVSHGLGGQPALEDTAIIPDGPNPIWVASVTATTVTIQISPAAPAAGRTFTLSASRQP
jgi:hypothetical protein